MKINTLFNTIRYLKPIQFYYRIKNKFNHSKAKKYTGIKFKTVDLFIDELHNDKDYLKRFNTNGNSVELLNQQIELDFKGLNKYSPLIRFNAEYFEYAIVWAQKGIPFDDFKQKWNEYVAADIPLQPYVISLQLPNLVIAMNLYGIQDQDIYDELFSRYKWLIKHQEKHLLANHYFENLKAIIIGSCLFNEEKVLKKYVKRLYKECAEQILSDGVHFELSLMYHKLILEDLLLINRVAHSKMFVKYIQLMLNAMTSLEDGFNRTPLFNDAGDNVAKSASSLIRACKNELGLSPSYQNSFPIAGYYKLRCENISVLIDAGYIGPNYNPGHSHCDCLSFEVFIDKQPLFVNSGTYQYQGEKRQYFRSTKAHNTLMIDNHEQSDLWGEHRAGKRIKKVAGTIDSDTFCGTFLNQFNEKSNREISFKNGYLSVLDSFESVKEDIVARSYLHLAPGYSYQDGMIIGFGTKYIIEFFGCTANEEESVYSSKFGVVEKNICLVFSWKTDKKKHGYAIKLIA